MQAANLTLSIRNLYADSDSLRIAVVQSQLFTEEALKKGQLTLSRQLDSALGSFVV